MWLPFLLSCWFIETLLEHTSRIVVLRKISLDFVKFGKILKTKHKDMYLHSMPVKMAAAAAASKAVGKLSLLSTEMWQEVPDIEQGDLEQALKKAPLFLAIIFSYFCVFLAEQWNHDVIASSKTGRLPNWSSVWNFCC